jgi:hypothetical protein
MTHHVGYLTITDDNIEYAKTLTSVGGGLDIRAECELPALTSVGGWLGIWSKCELPALTSVGGWLGIWPKCELPALASVGGGLDIRAECELPVLTSMYGVPGRLIAVSRYGLWKSNKGLYYAGCRKGLTLDQAIDHWIDRTDERALKFIGAILANLNE